MVCGMRFFYLLPADQGVTNCVNFDHVTRIQVSAKTIEIFLLGVEQPMVLPKTTANLSMVAKGMDLSDTNRDQVNNL